MSAFTSEVTEFPTAAEAEAIIAEATATGTSTVEHKMLMDAVQIIALSGISLDRVIGAGVRKALALGYAKGETYDYFDQATIAYGKHLDGIVRDIKRGDTVVQSMVHTGSYSKGRTSLKLVSDLITPETGAQYFEIERQYYNVSTGTFSAVKTTDETIGLITATELYVHDLSKGQFYFMDATGGRVGVNLAIPGAYTVVYNAIQASGILDAYKASLNLLSNEAAREFKLEAKSSPAGRNSAQQKLFLKIFKAIKADIVPIA
jgi:hypothetical protein